MPADVVCCTMTPVLRLIVADAHLGQVPGDATEMIKLIDEALSSGVGELIYLGDAFQYLIGMSKFWTADGRSVIESWRRARHSGVRICLIEGNRDFFLDEPDLAGAADWTGRTYEFSAGDRNFVLTHGDRVNLRDVSYRFWAAVSKSYFARLWARLLPQLIAVTIVRRMEARLAKTNRRFRYRLPTSSLKTSAEKTWAAGADVVLWGHFHRKWSLVEGGKVAMVVPAWLETRRAVIVEPDGEWRLVGPGLTWESPVSRM
jgi:UDP-2,3-diacylglucosamine hydrolase